MSTLLQNSTTSHNTTYLLTHKWYPKGFALLRQSAVRLPLKSSLCFLCLKIHTYSFGFNPKGYGFNPKGYGFNPRGYGFNPKGYGFDPKSYGFDPKSYGFNPKGYGFDPEGYGFDPEGCGFNPKTNKTSAANHKICLLAIVNQIIINFKFNYYAKIRTVPE